MYQGRCECDSTCYQFSGVPLTCYTCHCTDCQTSSGSAFSMSMIVQENDLIISKGKIAIKTTNNNGIEVKKHQCENCGTTFWYSADEYPGMAALKPGTFDDTSWFTPVAHLWTRSAQPWVKLDKSIPQYEKQPGISELIALWEKNQN